MLVFAMKSRERRRFVADRAIVELSEQWRELPAAVQVSEALFCEVIERVGLCYRIEPRLLRANDSLADLSSLDSWTLSSGEEDMHEWLRSRGIDQVDGRATLQDIVVLLHKQGLGQ